MTAPAAPVGIGTVGAAAGGPVPRQLAAHGLSVELPERWEGRLYLRPSAGTGTGTGSDRHPEGEAHPVLHLANFALPPGRGDFGTGAVERMHVQHGFVSLFEYEPVEAHRPLFEAVGVPRPVLADFAEGALQRRIRGQLGVQRFFTESDRAFCLYLVLGSRVHGPAVLGQMHRVLASIRVGRR